MVDVLASRHTTETRRLPSHGSIASDMTLRRFVRLLALTALLVAFSLIWLPRGDPPHCGSLPQVLFDPIEDMHDRCGEDFFFRRGGPTLMMLGTFIVTLLFTGPRRSP
jgi:hypothetical protein